MDKSPNERIKNDLLFLQKTLFPKMANKPLKTKILVYTISIFHIIGAYFILIGIYFPPKYLKLYILYITLIFISYYFFDGYCFLTLLPNKYSGIIDTPLTITMNTARIILIILLIIALLELRFPKYCLYNLIVKIFEFAKNTYGFKSSWL